MVLRHEITKTNSREARKNKWILEETWRPVDTIVSAIRDPARDQGIFQLLGRQISAILKVDWRRRNEQYWGDIESLLTSNPSLTKEAWYRMKWWYNSAADCVPTPSQLTIKWITAEPVELYHHLQPSGENISVFIAPFQIYDSVPTEEEIEWSVRQISSNRSGVLSSMRSDKLRKRLLETCKEVSVAAVEAMEEEAGAEIETNNRTKTTKI